MTSLKSILLDAINDNLASSTYDSPNLNNKDHANWSDMKKFNWAFDRYQIEVGRYESLEYWFSGLALSTIPFTYYDIERLGFNSETFFQDLSDELQKITGRMDKKSIEKKYNSIRF